MTMQKRPLVSIITPSYNQGEFLDATMRSVFEQDYAHIEYLVIDGGSTDGSEAVIRGYGSQLAYWVSEPDNGQAHAINKGLQRATGSIIGWLNSDDVMLPSTVSRVIETFQAEPDVDVVYGRLNRIDDAGNPVPTPILPKDQVTFDNHHAIGECIVNQPGSFWRRRVMEQAGLLNEDLNYALDYEYWVRLLLAGARFKRLPEPVADFRLSADSKTVGQTTSMAREHLAVIDAFIADPDLAKKLDVSDAELRDQARQGKALINLYAFYGAMKEDGIGSDAAGWLRAAIRTHPQILLSRRWFDLGMASIRRRVSR